MLHFVLETTYVVSWTYTVNDSKLDPLNATLDGKPTKDQKFTVSVNDGTTTVDTEVVLHLFGRDEIKFSDDAAGNNVFVGTGNDNKPSNPGNDILYLGTGDDRADASDGSDVIYREGTASQLSNGYFNLIDGSPVFFGDYSQDAVYIKPQVKDGIVYMSNGNDVTIFLGNRFVPYSNLGNANYVWGGNGSDAFHQLMISEPNVQVQDWIMDFDSRNPSEGGDKIRFWDQDLVNNFLTPHEWDKKTTQLEEKYANSSHLFLSEGATYYELKIIDADGNSSSVLNLVGTNITLDGLFENKNLVL